MLSLGVRGSLWIIGERIRGTHYGRLGLATYEAKSFLLRRRGLRLKDL
jgi:hypothetical protein